MTDLDPSRPWRDAVQAKIVDQVIECLDATSDLRSAAVRDLLLRRFSRFAGRTLYVPDFEVARDWMVAFVEGAAEEESGLSALVETVRFLRPGSRIARDLRRLLDEWDAAPVAAMDPVVWDLLRAEFGPVRAADVGDAFHRAGLGPHPPPHCDSAWHVLVYTAALYAPPRSLPSWLLFLIHSADLMKPSTHRQVELWQREFAYKAELTPQLDQAVVAGGRQLASREHAGRRLDEFYVVVQFESDLAGTGRFSMTCWHQRPGDPQFHLRRRRSVARSELAEATRAELAAADALLAVQPVDVVLEMILPIELINVPIETWEGNGGLGSGSLLDGYPVVIRSLDRLRRAGLHRVWRVRWEKTRRNGARQCAVLAGGIGRGAMASIHAAIAADETATAMILNAPPEAPHDRGLYELGAALTSGIPLIAWHRHAAAGPAEHAELRDILDGSDLAELPRAVRRTNLGRLSNAEAADEGNAGDPDGGIDGGGYSGRDANDGSLLRSGESRPGTKMIALLIDDPGRLPEGPPAGDGDAW